MDEQLISRYSQYFSTSPTILARAPGRVNLLGEHVDYNNGPVLPAAIDRSVRLVAGPRADNIITLVAMDLKDQKYRVPYSTSFRLDDLANKINIDGAPLPSWALYPAGVAMSLQQAGYPLTGMQAIYTSDVPIGSGLSSSAAVEVAFAVAFQALNGWQVDRMRLARLCQLAENKYVGVSSGLMDQFASAHGVAGHALYFDTRDLTWEAIALPQETSIVIADSGIRHSLSNSAYNQRRSECEQAVEILRKYIPGMNSLRDISPGEFAAYSEFLPLVIHRRAEHIVKEIARVGTAVIALRRGETRNFGALMFAGHISLRDLYEVSVPELDSLVDIARGLPGCFGARLTGAGFGGCTVNLVEESQAPGFMDNLHQEYKLRTGRETQVYLCKASDGASIKYLPVSP